MLDEDEAEPPEEINVEEFSRICSLDGVHGQIISISLKI